jgi:uncharacterized integral membrane protein
MSPSDTSRSSHDAPPARPGAPSDAPRTASEPSGSFGRTLWRHRRLLLRLLGLLLVVVFVLQNSEPTTIDFLFWSLPSAPKLVLILTGMALGILIWEISRRLLKAGSDR